MLDGDAEVNKATAEGARGEERNCGGNGGLDGPFFVRYESGIGEVGIGRVWSGS